MCSLDLSPEAVKNYFRICSAAHTSATRYLRLGSGILGGQTYRGMVQELGDCMVEHMQRPENKPLKDKGKPFCHPKQAFYFLKTVIVDWCTSIGSKSGHSSQMKMVVKMALFLSMPYLSSQISHFESKGSLPVSSCVLWWFRDCCEGLGECDDPMWKVIRVPVLVCDEPYSIRKTLQVFDHGRALPAVLDWEEAVNIRLVILQAYLEKSQGKLTLEESEVINVELQMPDPDAEAHQTQVVVPVQEGGGGSIGGGHSDHGAQHTECRQCCTCDGRGYVR